MPYSEADTRAKLIDPALHARGWTEALIRREETTGEIEIIAGKPLRRAGRIDYTLRIKATADAQQVAVALIEAKAENLPPNHGLEQGKAYGKSRLLNVQFIFSSNGHLFVEFDRAAGLTSDPKPLSQFPTPTDLRARYEQAVGFQLTDQAARPLLMRYTGGEGSRRYYQDAAIRAVLEQLARGDKRALLSLATGSGKTFIAVNLLKRIADAGQLRKALFLCDRDELRIQGLGAFQNVFGADAAPVSSGNAQKNARILIATYQTLNVDSDEATANFLTTNYPTNYFSHIIIDECHRSAWGKWSEVLTRNPDAIQIGLTATPRRLDAPEESSNTSEDVRITADNVRHFGEPVYEYDMSQGIKDGYLAALELRRFDLFHEHFPTSERERGVTRDDLASKTLVDAKTGELVGVAEARAFYSPAALERRLVMPDRVKAMAEHLFSQLLETGGPEQKSIVFCASDAHADDVAAAMNNLYAAWCVNNGRPMLETFAFKCTASVGGADQIADLKGGSRHHFIAATVDLLTTGVDVPVVRNIAFFKYVESPIAFYQMVGRGTRLDPATGKLMFRVYDYTNASRLFGKEFLTHHVERKVAPDGPEGPDKPKRTLRVEGMDVQVTESGTFIVTEVDGKATPIPLEEYKKRLAAALIMEAPTLEEFRRRWIVPTDRHTFLDRLPDNGRSAILVRELDDMNDYDLYDTLGGLGYGIDPKRYAERADAFVSGQAHWLNTLPPATAATLKALAAQFAQGGTDGLENHEVFQTPEVMRAGSLNALRLVGEPRKVLLETKQRLFAA